MSQKRLQLLFWIPFAFCAALSGIGLFSGGNIAPGLISFTAFMPMAFYFVGAGVSQLHEQVRQLQQRVEALEGKLGASEAPAHATAANGNQISLAMIVTLACLMGVAIGMTMLLNHLVAPPVQ